MFECPYCSGLTASAKDAGGRRRPDAHALRKCNSCNAYSVAHSNGRVYPLSERDDPDADVVNRIVD